MKNCAEFIASGILELYVLELTTATQNDEVEQMAENFPEIMVEINAISMALERDALANAIAPDPIVKPFLMATIDYMERMKAGEEFSSPPILNEASQIADYAHWIERGDMVLTDRFEDVYAKILSATEKLISAVVWIKEMAPQEVHDDEYEKFLILEGTCTITIENEIHSLKRGDYLTIPLHKNHYVTVTSEIPCKVLLQRVKI